MNQPILYLMAGYPGAGKTTIASTISKLTGAVHLSSDKTRFELFDTPAFTEEEHKKLYQTLDQETQSLLAEGKSVIYDANLNRYQHRAEKYAICDRLGVKAILVWVQTPRSLAKERATHESRAHFAPRDETLATMFDRVAGVIEPPREFENPIIIDGSNANPDVVARALSL